MAKYVVRYGEMRFLGVFSAHSSAIFCRDARVIIRTERGLEAGVVLGEATETALAALKDPSEGQILRTMTAEDEHELLRIAEQARREQDICQRYVDQLGLAMSLVELERIFGGERVVVYYLAENRVDFRELVRLLAAELQTRIEMRQIGVRDEAKLLADFGDCGKPTCCNSHLAEMPPVSMRMAKMQKATLDPTKISGRCGRLKCCLRYEFEMYEQQETAAGATGRRPVGPPGCCHRSRRFGAVSRRSMLDPAIAQLLKDDPRYPLEAYIFVFEALHYAQSVLGMGSESVSEPPGEGEEEAPKPERHVTGQELCQAIRSFALEQYGYMAKLVLGNWGLHATSDFGEIVFNLIRVGQMRKTPQDRREDFDGVYDFDSAFREEFRIVMPEK